MGDNVAIALSGAGVTREELISLAGHASPRQTISVHQLSPDFQRRGRYWDRLMRTSSVPSMGTLKPAATLDLGLRRGWPWDGHMMVDAFRP